MEKKFVKVMKTISVMGTAYVEVEIPVEEYIKECEWGSGSADDYVSTDIKDLDIDFSGGVEVIDDDLIFPDGYDDLMYDLEPQGNLFQEK